MISPSENKELIPVEPEGRGGFRKPLSVQQFVIEHLRTEAEDHPAAMHKAYKERMSELELPERRRGRPYKVCTYYSFTRQLQAMKLEGIITRSDRVEESDSLHTQHWPVRPVRHYYKLRG